MNTHVIIEDNFKNLNVCVSLAKLMVRYHHFELNLVKAYFPLYSFYEALTLVCSTLCTWAQGRVELVARCWRSISPVGFTHSVLLGSHSTCYCRTLFLLKPADSVCVCVFLSSLYQKSACCPMNVE